MSLPMICIFDRHWDTTPLRVLLKLLPQLAALGYDTLCFESPYDEPSDAIIPRIEATINFFDTRTDESYKWLAKYGIKVQKDLADFSFTDLAYLLRQYVSSKKYMEMAEFIKFRYAFQLKLEMLRTASALGVEVKSVDFNSDQYSLLMDSSYFDGSRQKAVNETTVIRDLIAANFCNKYYKERKGVILLRGAFHAQAILGYLSSIIPQEQLLFYIPHSSENFLNNKSDFKALDLDSEPYRDKLALITSDETLDKFTKKVCADIESCNRHTLREAGQSTLAKLLSSKFNVTFKSYLRPSYIAEAHLDFDSTEKTSTNAVKKSLQQHNISYRYGLFDGKKHLIVDGTNTDKVAQNIMKATSF